MRMSQSRKQPFSQTNSWDVFKISNIEVQKDQILQFTLYFFSTSCSDHARCLPIEYISIICRVLLIPLRFTFMQ